MAMSMAGGRGDGGFQHRVLHVRIVTESEIFAVGAIEIAIAGDVIGRAERRKQPRIRKLCAVDIGEIPGHCPPTRRHCPAVRR